MGKFIFSRPHVAPPSGDGFPDSTNTGYLNAPGYPGSLTPHSAALVPGTTYSFKEFFEFQTITAANCTFIGCRFIRNWTDGWNIKMLHSGTSTFQFCTIEPSAVSAPPVIAWPSAGAGANIWGGDQAAYMIAYGDSYQYGVLQDTGALLMEDCDIWGFGNSISLFGTEQKTIRRCWIHDASEEGTGPSTYHQDGPGHLNNTGCSNVLIEDCTIASLGNTNAIAFQGGPGTYHDIIVRRNYISGFGYCIDMGHGVTGNTGLVFEDNIISTIVGWIWGPLEPNFAPSFSEPTNSWSGNTLLVHPGSTPNPASADQYTAGDNGKFVHPDGTYSVTDWT